MNMHTVLHIGVQERLHRDDANEDTHTEVSVSVSVGVLRFGRAVVSPAGAW